MAEVVIARQTCDRCGAVREKEYVSDDNSFRRGGRPKDYSLVTVHVYGGGVEALNIDVCPDCADQVKQFAAAVPATVKKTRAA